MKIDYNFVLAMDYQGCVKLIEQLSLSCEELTWELKFKIIGSCLPLNIASWRDKQQGYAVFYSKRNSESSSFEVPMKNMIVQKQENITSMEKLKTRFYTSSCLKVHKHAHFFKYLILIKIFLIVCCNIWFFFFCQITYDLWLD